MRTLSGCARNGVSNGEALPVSVAGVEVLSSPDREGKCLVDIAGISREASDLRVMRSGRADLFGDNEEKAWFNYTNGQVRGLAGQKQEHLITWLSLTGTR